MHTVTRPRVRKPAQPVSVTYCWRRPVVWPCLLVPCGLAGCLEINGVCYDVQPLQGNGSGPDAPVVGYRLTHQQANRVYDLDATQQPFLCDCPDRIWTTRPDGECKHSRGLREALAERGQL